MSKLKGKSRYTTLYHYTSFESFVKIWLSKSLKFCSINNVNDVFESKIIVQSNDLRQLPLMKAYIDLRAQYKQISLTMDYDFQLKGCMSPCMWGYYADKTNGVCIELNYDKIQFPNDAIQGPIKYSKFVSKDPILPSNLSTQNQLIDFIRRNAKNIFLTKHNSWKGENEYRIVSRDTDYLDISNAIEAIHLTSYNSDDCLFVEKLVNDEVPVKFLHYRIYNGQYYPIMTETKGFRQQMDEIKNNPKYTFESIADELCQTHKDDWDYPLILNL